MHRKRRSIRYRRCCRRWFVIPLVKHRLTRQMSSLPLMPFTTYFPNVNCLSSPFEKGGLRFVSTYSPLFEQWPLDGLLNTNGSSYEESPELHFYVHLCLLSGLERLNERSSHGALIPMNRCCELKRHSRPGKILFSLVCCL